MKNETIRRLSKGVRSRCASAIALCARLEACADGITEALTHNFARYLGGCQLGFDVRNLTLVLIHAIRQLYAELVDAETSYQQALAGLTAARGRRDETSPAVYEHLGRFKRLEMWNRGPVFAAGPLPRRPDEVHALAAGVRPHLDSPDLRWPVGEPFGLYMKPELVPEFDRLCAELGAALEEIETGSQRSRRARRSRDEVLQAFDAHLSAARSLLRTLRDLRTLARDQKD